MSWDGSYPDRPGLGAGLQEHTLLGKLPSGTGARSTSLFCANLGSSWPQRPPHGFLVNMKLEAVDRRTPSFIRVASVEDVEDHRIKVSAEVSVLSLCPGTVLACSCTSQLTDSCRGKVCGGLWKHTMWRMAGPSARFPEWTRSLCCSSSLPCCLEGSRAPQGGALRLEV